MPREFELVLATERITIASSERLGRLMYSHQAINRVFVIFHQRRNLDLRALFAQRRVSRILVDHFS